ncbi:cytochrome P450 [Hypoxylon sp. EC38]|nr:cytochrome P450 [Hypoxylon sp. EC38]
MLRDFFQNWPVGVTGCLLLGFLLLVWRLWTFTLKPWLWPSMPKEMPYWIPIIGHTINFFRDYAKIMENGLNSTGRTREPFAIQLLGKKLYVCTSPSDVSTIFDNTVCFNFDNHLTELLTSFGISGEALRQAWHKPEPGDWCYVPNNPFNPKQKNLIHCVEDIYRIQLLPGDHMDEWSAAFLRSVQTSLRGLDSLAFCTTRFDNCVWCNDCTPRRVSLYSLVSFFSVQATANAIFGPHLLEIDPLVVQHMLSFNEHVWMILFHCPNVFGLPVNECRAKLKNAVRTFVQLPKHKRSQASWAITNVLDGMEIVGMDIESKVSMIVMIFWAAVSNEHNSCFWLLAHLLYDEFLMKLAQDEIEAPWRGEELDIKFLSSNSPHLDSIFNEVLRLNNTAAAVRVVSQDTILGGKELKAGSTILMPFRQLHMNEDVWGGDVSQFNPSRFLKKKSLTRSPAFRPFGGGATLCPGQTLARQEIFGFIAILLRRFRLEVAKDSAGNKLPFPRLNSMTPSFGLNGPMKGMDVFVDIAEK